MRKLLIVTLGVSTATAAPRFDAGLLSEPRGAPVETVARDFLARRPDLAPGGELRLERARDGLVRFRRHHRGVPIVGGVVTVRVDDRGRVRWSGSDGGVVPADLGVVPGIPVSGALRVASGGFFDDAPARLVVWAPPGRRARLAWDVRLPFDLRDESAWRVLVDAQDGHILYRQNQVMRAKRGKVFLKGNPAVGPVEEVTLDLADGAQRLENADIVTRTCVDTMACPVKIGTTFFRKCAIEPRAMADANGDFLYDRPAMDSAVDDEFAEVQMYFHADRVLTKFRSLGFGALPVTPMEVVANYRQASDETIQCVGQTSTAPLLPYENAFFTPGGPGSLWSKPTIVFGQWETIDASYDGDVVYHEFTHAVQSMIYDISFGFTDEYGLNLDGHAMNEATADYFSSSITGDPMMSEYALASLDALRDLASTKTCPADLVGEEHFDSEVYSPGLWDVRSHLPEGDRNTFDQAVYNGMDAFGDFESFGTANEKILAETELLLGGPAAATARATLTAHGLTGCNNRVADFTPGQTLPLILATGTSGFGAGVTDMPASFQWKMNLTKAARTIYIKMLRAGTIGGSFTNINIVLKPGDQPIIWDPDLLTSDATRTAIVIVGGTYFTAIDGTFPAGPYVMQLVNQSPGTLVLIDYQMYTDAEGGPPVPDAGPPRPDAGPMVMGDGGGCCQVGGGLAGATSALLLGLLTLFVLRRRA